MSIRQGNKIIANKTVPSVYTAGQGITIDHNVIAGKDATYDQKGIAKLATEEEIVLGVSESSVVNALQLNKAIDKEAKARLVADESIALTKLQDYLYMYESIASDMSYEEAIKYFEENFHNRENVLTATIPYGACSSIRNGNFYGRNYDWYYNTNTTFVVYDKAQKDKYEFLGVAQSVLDEIDFDSETTIEKIRLIPYLILDGVNEHGVFCNTNVVPTGDLGITTGTHADLDGDYICQIMLPKYVLDHFTNATDAVNWIRDEAKIFAPRNATTQLELHFMVGDPNHTYIVEFVHNEAVISEVTNSKQEVMTNFYRYGAIFDENGHVDFNSVTAYGSGLERYNILVDAYDSVNDIASMRQCIDLVEYTKAYSEIYTDPVAKIINPNTWKTEWAHDYSDSTILPHPMDLHANSPLSDYEYSGIFDVLYYMYQNRSRETGTTWQTVHSSVYDIERKELYLKVQEGNKQYHFVYPTTPRILQNIDEEVERAKAAEIAISGDVTEEARIRYEEDARLEGLIINETSRATEAETRLQENIDAESQTRSEEDIRLEGLITAETERAETKEDELDAAIKAEEQARIDADTNLSNRIDSEIQDRTDADTELSNRITTNTEAIADINEELDTYGNIVTHNVNEFATAAQGELADTALQPEDVINDVQHTDTNLPLSANMGKELQDQIDNLKARGRYLSQWNAVTGQPATQPTELPYPYKTGDYFLVGTVGEVNYKPTGTSYTGAASTEIETAELGIDDTYFFDGTVWHLQQNTQKTVTFASLAGQPTDNANLAAALNTKVDKTNQSSKIYGTDTSGNQTLYDKEDFGKVDDVRLNGMTVVVDKIANIEPEAVDVAYTNEQYPEMQTLQDAMDKLLYITPTVSISGGGNYEIGSSRASTKLTWTWNKAIKTQSLNQGIGSLDPALRTYTYNTSITSDTTFTITGSDGTTTKTASTSVKFLPKRYWGVSANTSLTDAQIIALSSELSTSRTQTRTFDCSGGKYFYFAIKTSYCSGIKFKVGGLSFSDMLVETRQFTNASGHTDSYNIYRVNSIQTGASIVVEIS